MMIKVVKTWPVPLRSLWSSEGIEGKKLGKMEKALDIHLALSPMKNLIWVLLI